IAHGDFGHRRIAGEYEIAEGTRDEARTALDEHYIDIGRPRPHVFRRRSAAVAATDDDDAGRSAGRFFERGRGRSAGFACTECRRTRARRTALQELASREPRPA